MSRSDLGSLVGVANVHDTCNMEALDTSTFVRRSNRNPDIPMINRPDVKSMLEKIKNNHPSTVIFKAKDHLRLPVSPRVFSEIIAAFATHNTVCQALYIQNMDGAIHDEQIEELMQLLEDKKQLWAINIGENYEVSKKGWTLFCSLLPRTHVTHLYVSEHVIQIDLKNTMRMHIRANRKKHTLHSSVRNIRVIEKVTHMWWNPINTIRHQLDDKGTVSVTDDNKAKINDKGLDKAKSKNVSSKTKTVASPTPPAAQKKTKATSSATKAKGKPAAPVAKMTKKEAAEARRAEIWHARQEFLRSNPKSTVYWAKSKGGKGAESWKFHCSCGEQCSSEEHERVHPVGAMYECTSCSIWSHTACVLGNVTQEYLEEEDEVLCAKCRAHNRRQVLRELKELNLNWVDGKVAEHSDDEKERAEGEKDNETSMTDSVMTKRKEDGEGENEEGVHEVENMLQAKKKFKLVAESEPAPEVEAEKKSGAVEQELELELDDPEVTAALEGRGKEDEDVEMPEVTRGDSPSDTSHRITSSPVSPLLSMDMHPTSFASATTAATSSTSASTSAPLPPPPNMITTSSPGTSTRSPIELNKPPPLPLSPSSSGNGGHAQAQTQRQLQSQSINHIGHSSFTLLTSSPLLSNNNDIYNNGTSNNNINHNNGSPLSLPTSPLSTSGSSSVPSSGSSLTPERHNRSLPTLLNPLTTNVASATNAAGTTVNKNQTTTTTTAGPGSVSTSASFDPPMLLQTGNLVPLQDWMSALTHSSLLAPPMAGASGGPGAGTGTEAGTGAGGKNSCPSPSPSSSSSTPSTGSALSQTVTSGQYNPNTYPPTSSKGIQKKVSTESKPDVNKPLPTAAGGGQKIKTLPSPKPVVSPKSAVASTHAGGAKTSTLSAKTELNSHQQIISPISSPGSHSSESNAVTSLSKEASLAMTQQATSSNHIQSSAMNKPSTQIPISASSSHASNISSTSRTSPPHPSTHPNTAPRAEMPVRQSPPIPSSSSLSSPNSSSPTTNNKTAVAIKLSTGMTKVSPVVKAMGSPRSSCKTVKAMGSPKGTSKKALKKSAAEKAANSTPTILNSEMTALVMSSTRASCDAKMTEMKQAWAAAALACGSSSPHTDRDHNEKMPKATSVPTASAIGTATTTTTASSSSSPHPPFTGASTKKPSKTALSKLNVDTSVNPLSLAASRGRSMTTGDLESKVKGKPPKMSTPKVKKTSKLSKLDSFSLANLAGLEDGSIPIKRPRRSSKGCMFVFGARVYVPAEHKVGIITEEKNGGWKYVTYDTTEKPEGSISTSTTSLSPTYESDASNSNSILSNASGNNIPPAPPPPPPPPPSIPTLHTSNSESSVCGLMSSMSVVSPRPKTTKSGDTKGKWCRACDMREVDIGDMPLPNKADKLMNLSHLHPREPAMPGLPLDLGLSSFITAGETDYGLDLADGGDNLDHEQDDLMLLGRRVAYHHPVTSKLPVQGNTKRKRCESLDTGMRGMDSFFDYALFMNNNLSSVTGNGALDEGDLVEDDWKLEIGSFGGVFLDDDAPEEEVDCWNNM